jgi:transcriptional regulator with XRE-family HTH domain
MASRHPQRYRAFLVRLRDARKAAGMSQEAVAAALGVKQKFVSKIEVGDRRVDPVELDDLAKLYGKPVSWFLEE